MLKLQQPLSGSLHTILLFNTDLIVKYFDNNGTFCDVYSYTHTPLHLTVYTIYTSTPVNTDVKITGYAPKVTGAKCIKIVIYVIDNQVYTIFINILIVESSPSWI